MKGEARTQEGKPKGHKQIAARKRRNANKIKGFKPDWNINVCIENRGQVCHNPKGCK